MDNFFDQYDQQPGNYFDQFDQVHGSTVLGSAKAFGSGAVRSAAEMAAALGRSSPIGEQSLPGDALQQMQPSPIGPGQVPTGDQTTQYAEKNITGPLYKPPKEATIERGFEAAGAGVPYMAVPGAGGVLARAAGAILPQKGSFLGGEIDPEGPMHPVAQLAGGVLTPAGVASAGRMVTPFESSPARLRSVEALRAEGIQPTAGQVTGSDRLMRMERQLGGGGKFAQADEAFTAAALKKGGIEYDTDKSFADLLNSGFGNSSVKYKELTTNNPVISLDKTAADEAKDVLKGYHARVEGGSPAKIVQDYAYRIEGSKNLSGEEYQNLRSEIGRDARSVSNNPNLQRSLYGLQNALDDGAERSIAATNPADLGKWKEARQQYRNLLVLQNAGGKAGEKVAEGMITPANLKASADQVYGRSAYARGKGDFSDLARSGYILNAPKSSGTAENMAAINLHAGIPAIAGGFSAAGAAAPAIMGHGEFSIPGAILGAALPHAVGGAIMSGPMQKYLANQLLTQFKPDIAGANRGALINALLQGGQRMGQ